MIWCIGFQPDFGWLDVPVFNGRGQPGHVRGVTAQPGLYFLGLPWLHTWGSGRFSGVARDALYLAESTVKWYWQRIFDKLDVRDRTALGDLAREQGLHRAT